MGHMGPLETQKGGRDPPQGTKKEVQGPSGAPFLSLFGPILNVFQYHSRPPFDYAELCSHQYPTTKIETIRRDKRANEQTNEGANERTNKRTKNQTKNQTSDQPNERAHERRNEHTNDRMNERNN